MVLPLHIGTHIDALCHAWYDDALYNGFPGIGTRSTSGATRCGIDKMGPIVGRGVLLDVAGSLWRAVGGWCRDRCGRFGARGEPGRRERWQRRYRAASHRLGGKPGPRKHVSFDGEPGLDLEAALWLAEREIAVLGADNFAVEVIPFAQGTVFPVHQRLIRDFGIPLLEGLLLHDLAATGRHEFMFAASPLPVVGGTGSPVNPIVIL